MGVATELLPWIVLLVALFSTVHFLREGNREFVDVCSKLDRLEEKMSAAEEPAAPVPYRPPSATDHFIDRLIVDEQYRICLRKIKLGVVDFCECTIK